MNGSFKLPHPYISLKHNGRLKWCPLGDEEHSSPSLEITFRTRAVISQVEIIKEDQHVSQTNSFDDLKSTFNMQYYSSTSYSVQYNAIPPFWEVRESVNGHKKVRNLILSGVYL